MRENIISFFTQFAGDIVFVHVFSAMVIIGGSLFFYLLLKNELITNIQEATKIYIKVSFISIILIIISAGIMAIGLDFKNGEKSLYMIVHIKEAIWSIIAIWTYLIYKNAKKQNYDKLKDRLFIIILFAVIAIFLGIKLRGF